MAMLRTSAFRMAALAAASIIVAGAASAAWLMISWPSAEPVGSGAHEEAPTESRVTPSFSPGREAATAARVDRDASKAPELSAAKPTDPRPSFDVVRIEPTGEAVIAGHFSPNSAIELTVDGRPVAEATADSRGDFIVMPSAFAAGAHRLELVAKVDPATSVRSDAVAVEVSAQASASGAEEVIRPSREAPTTVRPIASYGSETEALKPEGATKPPFEGQSAFERAGAVASRLHAPPSRGRDLLQLSKAAEAKRNQDLLALERPLASETEEFSIRGGGHTSK